MSKLRDKNANLTEQREEAYREIEDLRFKLIQSRISVERESAGAASVVVSVSVETVSESEIEPRPHQP